MPDKLFEGIVERLNICTVQMLLQSRSSVIHADLNVLLRSIPTLYVSQSTI